MTRSQVRVTVAMAVHDERAHLRAAVDSILAQTFTDFELVVVDDGSTDGCIDTIVDIDDDRLRILRQDNGGKAAALNRVLAVARGEYMCIQDGDDMANRLRLAVQVAALDADPELGAVFCRHELIVDGVRRSPRFRPADRAESAAIIARIGNPGMDPTIMMRLEMTRDIPFAEDLLIGQGEDHLQRVGERWPVAVVAGCHYAYRVHAGNRTKGAGERAVEYRREVIRRACERRGLPPRDVRRPRYAGRRGGSANVTGQVVESTIELRALGRRRRAVTDAIAHARRAWRYANGWLPLAYASVPGFVLGRLRPDFTALRDRWRTEPPVTC